MELEGIQSIKYLICPPGSNCWMEKAKEQFCCHFRAKLDQMDRVYLVSHGYQNGWLFTPTWVHHAIYRYLCMWRWSTEALKSLQDPDPEDRSSLTGRVGSSHTCWFSWRHVETSWSKGLDVPCHQWGQTTLEVPKNFYQLNNKLLPTSAHFSSSYTMEIGVY